MTLKTFIGSSSLLVFLIATSVLGQGASLVEAFDSGRGGVGGSSIPEIHWSGDGRLAVSGAAWQASSFYDAGFLNGPSGTAGDTYLYLYDHESTAQFYNYTTSFATSSSETISFDFINSFTTNGIQSPAQPRMAFISADGSLRLLATHQAPLSTTAWNTITISLDITDPNTTWFVSQPGNINQPSSTPATQSQLDSIIAQSGWTIRFGIEGITAGGGTGPTGPEFLAVDNLTFSGVTYIPEPSTVLLLSSATVFAVFRRRSRI